MVSLEDVLKTIVFSETLGGCVPEEEGNAESGSLCDR